MKYPLLKYSLILIGSVIALFFYFYGLLSDSFIYPAALFGGIVKGSFSGKLGNLIFGSWKGKQTVKTKPDTINISYSDSVMRVRRMFEMILLIGRKSIIALQVGFHSVVSNMSEFNYFLKINYPDSITGTYPNLEYDFPNFKFSVGNLYTGSGFQVTNESHSGFKIAWSVETNYFNSLPTDKIVSVVIIDSASLDYPVYISINTWTRGDGICTIPMPSSTIGLTAYSFSFFISSDGLLISDTVYVDSTVILDE